MKTKKEEDIIFYIKSNLGYPICSIELTDEQIKSCISSAETEYIFLLGVYNLCVEDDEFEKKISSFWIKRCALTNCKEIVAKIRGKFSTVKVPGMEYLYKTDYKQLYKEAKTEKKFLRKMVKTRYKRLIRGL